jgi:hypothetical protein
MRIRSERSPHNYPQSREGIWSVCKGKSCHDVMLTRRRICPFDTSGNTLRHLRTFSFHRAPLSLSLHEIPSGAQAYTALRLSKPPGHYPSTDATVSQTTDSTSRIRSTQPITQRNHRTIFKGHHTSQENIGLPRHHTLLAAQKLVRSVSRAHCCQPRRSLCGSAAAAAA